MVKLKIGVLLLVLIVGLVVVYLHFSYARIYNNRPPLANPTTEIVYHFNNLDSKTTVEYVALGDSLTVGVGSNNVKQTIPYLFAEKLATRSSVIMINLATPGATTNDVLSEQLSSAISEDPQYITLWIGVNDIHNLYSVNDFENNYESIIKKLKSSTMAKIIVINLPYLGSNMLIWPPYSYLLDLQTRQYNQAIQRLADKYQLTYIDLYVKSKSIPDRILYSSDYFHPSEGGYLLYGEIINANSSL